MTRYLSIPLIAMYGPEGDPAAEVDPAPKPEDKVFKQDDVNKILATEKRKFQKQIDDLTKLANEAKQRGESSDSLAAELENVRTSLRTKEEQAEHERQRIINENKTLLDAVTKERDKWKTDYTDSTLNRSLLDAGVVNKAHNPQQIVDLLRSKTELVDEINSEGAKTGRQVPQTTVTVPDKDGKTKVLKLDPVTAVKRLSELDTFANLFTSPANGGSGGKPNTPGSSADLREIAKDPKKYRELRKQGKLPFQQQPSA